MLTGVITTTKSVVTGTRAGMKAYGKRELRKAKDSYFQQQLYTNAEKPKDRVKRVVTYEAASQPSQSASPQIEDVYLKEYLKRLKREHKT